QAAKAQAERRQEEVAGLHRDRDAAQAALDGLSAGGAVPDAAALAAARAHRDQGWHLVFRTAFTPDRPTPEEERAFADGRPLPLAYQQAVVAADGIADQRLQDAETVGRIEAAKATLREAAARCDAAEATHRLAVDAQQAAAAIWTDACRTLNLGKEPTLKEVLACLAAREKALDAARSLALAEAEQAELARTHGGWAARLAALLGTSVDSAAGTNLAALLTQADTRLAAAQQAAKEQAAQQARLQAADKALTQARATQAQAQAARDVWQADWDAVLQALKRPAGEDPGVTDEVLTSLDALAEAHRDYVDLMERVAGMERDNARFCQDIATLAARVAADLDKADPFALVSVLRQRLQAAREAANQRALLTEQAQAAADTAAKAEAHLAAMRDDLYAILARIGATTVEEADHHLALAAERATHAAALAEAQARLADAGDAQPPGTLRQELASVAPDDIPRLIQAAGDRRQAAQLAAQEAAARVAELSQQMNAAEDATEAVDAAADQQAAVATMGRVLEQALLYHLAAEMLDKALAAVEQDSEPAMLQRITKLFVALTDGAYTRVLSEADDAGVARLTLVQRDYPDEHQAVADLSEGTRDQLYLALRLAAVEAHVAAAPPLPFIGDDILQTFDDDRALAALRVLREISETTQVILLTHHRHVLDLAQRLPEGSVHVCRAAATLEMA
ncbi:MAG: hypothetical protein JSS43_18555, partial [Proteobacteria bacterium]|nr:hypothetical protein [Pseudomonadota bacterium]